MTNFSKGFFLLLLTCCFFIETKAQMVEYELLYNEGNCNYEARMHVVSGSAVFPNNIPFPSQFSVLVPAAVADQAFVIETSSAPPSLPWSNDNNIYAPSTDPAHDYHAFNLPGGSGANAYSTFNAGDDILLFTFSLPAGACGSGVRLYINGVDPTSADPGMLGIDFSQSLKILAPGDVYSGNISNDEIMTETPVIIPTASCTATDVNLMANATAVCATISTYDWSGPNGFSSTDENPTFPVDADPSLQVGTYTLIATDSKGCSATATIDLGYDNCFVETCGPLCIPNNNVALDAIEPGLYNGTTIKSDGTVAPTTNVDYIAEEYIDLIPGFEVKPSATFLGDIAPCVPQ